jgi:hypothetical protein
MIACGAVRQGWPELLAVAGRANGRGDGPHRSTSPAGPRGRRTGRDPAEAQPPPIVTRVSVGALAGAVASGAAVAGGDALTESSRVSMPNVAR